MTHYNILSRQTSVLGIGEKRMARLNFMNVVKRARAQMALVSDLSFFLQHSNKYLIHTDFGNIYCLKRTLNES